VTAAAAAAATGWWAEGLRGMVGEWAEGGGGLRLRVKSPVAVGVRAEGDSRTHERYGVSGRSCPRGPTAFVFQKGRDPPSPSSLRRLRVRVARDILLHPPPGGGVCGEAVGRGIFAGAIPLSRRMPLITI
jgi:hypothetical protein